MSDWQPFETIPRDGRPVDIWAHSNPPETFREGRYTDCTPKGNFGEKFGVSRDWWSGVPLPHTMTHWMEVPAKPSSDKRDQTEDQG